MAFAKLFIPRKNYLHDHDGQVLPRDAFADELANYLAIERWANSLSGGGRRFATRTVGTTNSSVDTQSGDFDYMCTGINDTTTIQKAVNDLTTVGGGRVLLSEGLFKPTSVIQQTHDVWIEGNGTGTVVQAQAGFGSGSVFQNTHLSTGDGNVAVRRLLIDLNSQAGVEAVDYRFCTGFRIEDIRCVNGATGVDTIHISYTPAADGQSHIINNQIFSCGQGMNLLGCQGIVVAGNVLDILTNSGIGTGNNTSDIVIANNIIKGCTNYGMNFQTSSLMTVVGNTVRTSGLVGIAFNAGGSDSVVSGNLVRDCNQNGIWVQANDVLVVGNKVFECSVGTANGFANYLIDGTRVHVVGNMSRPGAQTPAFGLRVTAAGNACVIVMNDLNAAAGAWGTASYSDAGVGTITTFAANWNRL